MAPAWPRGTHVLLRQAFHGRVWEALPATVVEATGDRLVLWLAPGTPGKRVRGTAGGRVLPLAEWTVADHTWFGNGNVVVVPPGDPFALMLLWEDDGAFAGWYVNLRDPVRVTAATVETRDHALDVWIPARGNLELKDEDHLEQCVEMGVFSAREADTIRAAAEDVIARREELLPTGFEAFRPDPEWPVPALPTRWAALG